MGFFGLFGGSGGNILVVEDEPDIAEGVKAFLDKQGFTVSIAGDGALGVQMALKERFALIILDINLPVLDGFSVCQSLRRDPKTADVPVLVLTALNMISDVEKALGAGANDYIPKPYTNDRLLAKVNKLLGREGK
ncbi:MAG: response regulator [Elusimicrobia bacterium]|nr:response regulator [Elusimicrobiota bacterium]